MANNMDPFDCDSEENIHKWIKKKPLSEAVLWTPREKFYLIGSVITFGNNWKSTTQVLKTAGEPYRPAGWYSTTNCERQFKNILNNQTNEVKSMNYTEMLNHICEVVLADFVEDLKETEDSLTDNYRYLDDTMSKIRQGNLSTNEVNSLYSQTIRNDTESKQYMEQLRTRQIAFLASENSSSGSSEPVKWNAPPAPLLTSLLKSSSSVSNHKNNNTATSQLLSLGGTSRTRSGKLLPLSPSIKTTQGTPTLSKLLEAPANPYISSPPRSAQKMKLSEVNVTDRYNGNRSKKENLQSPVSNKVRVDNLTGPFNKLNKCDLSYSKRQTTISESKASPGIVNLLSDSESEEDNTNFTQNILPTNIFQFGRNNDNVVPKNIFQFGEKNIVDSPKKLLTDNKSSCEKNDLEKMQQQSEGSQMTNSNLVDDDVIDIDQIEVEPLSSVHDEIIISSEVTPSSSIRKIDVRNPAENSLSNKTNSKEINNQMLEEISADFVLNSSVKSNITDYKNIMIGHSQFHNTNVTGSLVPIDSSGGNDTIVDSFDEKLLKQTEVIEIPSASEKGFGNVNDNTMLTFVKQPVVVVKKIQEPFNFKPSSEIKDKAEDVQVVNYDSQNAVSLQGNGQGEIKFLDAEYTYTDEVIIIDDDNVCVSHDDGQKESSKSESETMSLKAIADKNISNIPSKITNSDKTLKKVLGKPGHLVNMSTKKIVNEDAVSKSETQIKSQKTNNCSVKVLDIDFDQSTTSLSELYTGVEKIAEMHSSDILDRGESSISEYDTTIGAFDTFAQITNITQKSGTSKDIKSVTGEIKTPKQDRNDSALNKVFVRAKENDEQGLVSSTTGLPILHGVITDVTKKKNSEKVADHDKLANSNTTLTKEIVEISSDEEGVVSYDSNNLKVVDKNVIQEHNREVNINKLNEKKLLTSKNLGTGDVDCETDIISSISIENTSNNIVMKCKTKETGNMQSEKEKDILELSPESVETKLISSNEILKKIKDLASKELDNNKFNQKELTTNTKETEEYQSKNINEKGQHDLSKSKNIEIQKTKDAGVLTSKLAAGIQDVVNEESIKEMYNTKLTTIDKTNKSKEVEKINTANKKKKKITETEFERTKEPKVKKVEPKKNVVLSKRDSDIEVKNKETETNVQQGSRELTSEEDFKKTKKLERPLVDSKKVVKENTKELESKISKIKEQEQPNIAGNEIKQNKEEQIITRTRGLKVEESKAEKLKESNYTSQNIPIKESIVLLESYVPPHTCDRNLSIYSNDCANEVGSKSRTRSSLSKQSKIDETKYSSSLKVVNQSESCAIPKASLGTKPRIATSLNHESPTTSSNSQRKLSLSQTDSTSRTSENRPKRLTSIDISSSNQEEYAIYTPVKRSQSIATMIEHFPQTTTENFDTSSHQKRGRKRRTSLQNEEVHQSNNEKLVEEYDTTSGINTLSTKAAEPPTKMTKKGEESFDNKMFFERLQNLKKIFENKCESNKTLLAIEEQIKKTSPKNLEIIKDSDYLIQLDDIKNNITSGKLIKLSDLQINILRMAVNCSMINDSQTTVLADDSSNAVINELADNKQFFQCSVNEDNVVDDDSEDEQLELSDHNIDNHVYEVALSEYDFENHCFFDSHLFTEQKKEVDSDICNEENSDNYNSDLF